MAWDRVSLADAMISRMDQDEVEDICFRLHVDVDNLDRKTKTSLVRSLIVYMERRQQLNVLAEELARLRPDIKAPSDAPLPPQPSNVSAPQPHSAPSDAPVSEDVQVPFPSSRSMPTPPPAVEALAPGASTAGPALGDRMTDPMGVRMLYVPPGAFRLGGWSGDTGDEVVIARGFWLDLMPVTNAMYTQFLNADGYTRQEFWSKAGWKWVQENQIQGPHDYEDFTDPGQPRVGVTWFEAYAYCRWRGGRLPTEAEWEWAARGPDNRTYPWGNEWDAGRVVCRDNSGRRTAFVDANTRRNGASWVGALDMSGNVWEWTSSLYRPYPYKAEDGRESLEDVENRRVVRGGSWYLNGYVLQAANRIWFDPSGGYYFLGFRCARDA